MDHSFDQYAAGIIQHFKMKRKGPKEHGDVPCPNCGGEDRFWINDRNGQLKHHCRKDCAFIDRDNKLQDMGLLPKWEPDNQFNPTSPTPYNVRRNIPLKGAKLQGADVIVSLVDVRTMKEVGTQTIKPDGQKLFTKGLIKEGTGAFIGEASDTLFVTEGWADAVVVHEATGHQVCFALDASNLPKTVALLGHNNIIIAADNDAKGIAAAEATGKAWVAPENDGEDWWDLFHQKGNKGVKSALKQLPDEAHDEPAPKKILTLISDVELKDPEYLIDDILEEKSLIGLIGPSGSGKTFVALDIALSLATGKDYHGFGASKGLVIMSAGEGHLGIPRRAEAWCKQNGSNLHAASFAITDRAVDLFNEAPLNAFCNEVEEIAKTRGNPKLIIIDTVARHMAGKEENNAKDMGELVQTADKLKHDYQCAVMLVHHTGHSNQDRARGSTAFKGALDTEILVKSLGDNDIIVSCEKQKDGPEFDTMQFVKVSVDPSIALQQVTRSVPKAKLTSNQAMAMDAFYEATKGNVASAGLALNEWRPLFNERHTGDNIGTKNKAFRRARKELVDKGLLKCSDDIYRLGDKAT